MAGAKALFACQECGYSSIRWLGRCPDCGAWNSFVEERREAAGGAQAPPGETARPVGSFAAGAQARCVTGVGELDRVLGGGLVAGSVTLLGGEPGIGKTTLLLQALASLSDLGRNVLYVSGEESGQQIRLRAERLGVLRDGLLVLVENCLENVMAEIERLRPEVVVVDSVQAVSSSLCPSPAGTLVQVREVAARLIRLAKQSGTAVFLVGHVTKEGSLAGPKTLEHMVDTVIYFEGDGSHLCRVVRTSKNRFGSTNEVGIFQMGDTGLAEVENPSSLFMGQGRARAGTVVVPSLEGQRPILVEVQALVSPSGYTTGRRSVSGLDPNRVVMLQAVLEKRGGMEFGSSDVYVNAAGGIRLLEPAADLGVLLALASSHRGAALPPATAAFGEMSLTGDVRGVSGAATRVREAGKLGFKRCVLPADCRDQLDKARGGLELVFVADVEEALVTNEL